ncbi:MAG: hypothetical protein ABIV28_00695 [Longimicrobiales bacterium]
MPGSTLIKKKFWRRAVEFMIPITLFMCGAAVLILRPLTKQLGSFLEAMTKERIQPRAPLPLQESDSARTVLLLEHLVRRLDVMEERLDFTERLVSTKQHAAPQLSVRNMPDIGLREEALHSAHR